METLKFKTTINCNNCKAKVSNVLNNAEGVNKWDVDVINPSKILSVETDNLSAADVIKLVKSAGFNAEVI
jgi:copper chaperone